MAAVPVISSYVLQGVSGLVRETIGEKALRQANRAAGLDFELIEDRHCFLPHQAVVAFIDAIGRGAGDSNLGLLLTPNMDIGRYGSFGSYVLGADTLGQGLDRSIAALRYHSTHDRLTLTAVADEIRFGYRFALAGAEGYGAVASAAAGVLLSLCRAYLPPHWRPLRVELDIDAPSRRSPFEDVFQCPVLFNAPAISVVVERHHLATAPRRPSGPSVTLEDVARDRPGGAPRRLLDVVTEQVRAQVLAGRIVIDDVARSMDISVRSLQRELQAAGMDFRTLTNTLRAQRATELLRHTQGSITRVSTELGYSSPAGFARAFRKMTGVGPREFRKLRR